MLARLPGSSSDLTVSGDGEFRDLLIQVRKAPFTPLLLRLPEEVLARLRSR
jgi:hypothetical protein